MNQKKNKPIKVTYTYVKDDVRRDFAFKYITNHIRKNLDKLKEIEENKKDVKHQENKGTSKR